MKHGDMNVQGAVSFSLKERFDAAWQRLLFEGQAVYVHRHSADWFVPNRAADQVLQHPKSDAVLDVLLQRIGTPNPKRYTPHKNTSSSLQEFWIHLTNRCNLTCRHCLFSSSPAEEDLLNLETILTHVREAYALGCRLFVISGGEPLVHPRFMELLECLLALEEAQIVILTNGLLIEKIFTCKVLENSRIRFQISLDGQEAAHDALRGKGTYRKLLSNAAWAKANGYLFSLALCVHSSMIHSLNELIEEAAKLGATHVHLLWYFLKGRGENETMLDLDVLFDALIRAYGFAQRLGVVIDNFEALKTQIFAPKGTVHDGSSSGRTSIALGYDGAFYPSAATVGEKALMMQGLRIEEALQSPIAQEIADASIVRLHSPLRFLLGGGDLDHSFAYAKTYMGDDPYEALMERLCLWLITQEAKRFEPFCKTPALCLEMGDILMSCGANEGVARTHANCLIATGESESLRLVKSFYHEAALEDKDDIVNPACYEASLLEHIPEAFRFRGYGCGSPILEAKLQKGETMLDLGSGRGIECFIASKLVGKEGRVMGVDMLDAMLKIAREGGDAVAKNLGYANLSFHQGYLESLPIEKESVDVVTSNCVLNLSTHKRALFSEIFRVLKEGGRLVVSDVVCDDEPSSAIRNDAKLSGECIAGALTQSHLIGLLVESGFVHIRLLKRFFYKEVQGHRFYSLSFEAKKASKEATVEVIYKGIGQSVVLEEGIVLSKGIKTRIPRSTAKALENVVFILDEEGEVENQEGESCCCAVPPEAQDKPSVSKAAADDVLSAFGLTPPSKAVHNCMACQKPLAYETSVSPMRCVYCGGEYPSSVRCKAGHFVCDACHSKEALEVIEHLCSLSQERDMLSLFRRIREHPSIPKHGPEHHAMVPAIILTAYKNNGGKLPENALKTALSRGSSVMGGACGFLGMCGAASGVGIAFAILLGASPVAATARATAQKVTHAALGEIAKYEAARCCHREVWTALKIASKLCEAFLHVSVPAELEIRCDQKKYNTYCYKKACPIF
jgi:MoaA/NifB/PqqE/SkfB family radical SAM enzyme/SAM-dependent methyltransferase